jgi:hypothetical protein
MRKCPDCAEPIHESAIECGSCHWRDPNYGKAGQDPLWRLCAHEDRGLRCGRPGVVSQSTSGQTDAHGKHASGPFYCWQHSHVKREEAAAREPSNRVFAIARELSERLREPKDPKAWAYKIMDRKAMGFSVPAIAVELASEAIRKWPPRKRSEADIEREAIQSEGV